MLRNTGVGPVIWNHMRHHDLVLGASHVTPKCAFPHIPDFECLLSDPASEPIPAVDVTQPRGINNSKALTLFKLSSFPFKISSVRAK